MNMRILLYENIADDEPSLRSVLEELGATVCHCRDRMALLEQVVGFRPRVIVYMMRAGSPADGSMLEMLRRLAPGVPLAVAVDRETPGARRIERDLAPIWIGLRSATAELCGALRAALSPGRSRAAG